MTLQVISGNTVVYWHHTDRQGSVVATSNAAGQVVATATYSPHGEFGTGVTAPPTGSPFGYTGRQYDPETGLYQYRARYYSPRLGVFLSTDPIGTKDDPNLYLYVGADPVNATDPTGKEIKVKSSTIILPGNMGSLTYVSMTFTASFENDGGTLPQGTIVGDAASAIEQQVESSYSGVFNDGAGNITIYDMNAGISIGHDPASDRHQITMVSENDTRVASATGRGAVLGRVPHLGARSAVISDKVFGGGRNTSLERTGAHEVGHMFGLDHPDSSANARGATRENLMS